MPAVFDRPITADPIVVDESSLDSDLGFEGLLCVIEVSEGKYAANNYTTPGPDPMVLNGLAVFETSVSANLYMNAKNGMPGDIKAKTLEECRQIVKDKAPVLSSLLFMVGPHIVGVLNVN